MNVITELELLTQPLQQVCVRKITSIRDFKWLAVAQIVQNEHRTPLFFLTVVSYEWINSKLYLCNTASLDDKIIEAHFPCLAKYMKWDGASVAEMPDTTRGNFFVDMAELFGFEITLN